MARHGDPLSDKTGICCSGGGMRSAAYNLGALQAFREHGILREADYLAGVAGGAYAAGAFAIASMEYEKKRQSLQKRADELRASPDEPSAIRAAREAEQFQWSPPFGRGSPEESYLRAHSADLALRPADLLGFSLRLACGFAVNFLVVVLALFLVGRAIGWVLPFLYPVLRTTGSQIAFRVSSVPVAILGVLFGAGVIVHMLIALGWSLPDNVSLWVRRIATIVLAAALVVGVAFVGVPFAIAQLSNDAVKSLAHRPIVPAIAVAQARARAHAVTHLIVSTIPGILHAGSAGKALGALGIAGGGVAATLATTFGRLGSAWKTSTRPTDAKRRSSDGKTFALFMTGLTRAISGLAIPAGFGVLLLEFVNEGVTAPRLISKDYRGLAEWFVALVVFVLLIRFADLTRWSMFPFVERRIGKIFAIARADALRADPVTRTEWPTFAMLSQWPGPELIICATDNLGSKNRATTGGTPVVFSSSTIACGGSDGVNIGYYEHELDIRLKENLTVPSILAIAASPFPVETGPDSPVSVRVLSMLANLRFGIWIPNPTTVADLWKRPRLASLGRRRQPRPGLQYLIREMRGRESKDDQFVYVYDAGDSLDYTVVELLRRKCRYIWWFDPTGDQRDTFRTLGRAIRAARADLGIEIDIDPSPLRLSTKKQASTTSVLGTIRYPKGLPDGELIYVRPGITATSPWDVQIYADLNANFPYDPTVDTSFDDERFDAYRALGESAARDAIALFRESAIPMIMCADNVTATVGSAFEFAVKTRSCLTASLRASDSLPKGLTFGDNHDGSATISGTPDKGTGGVYQLLVWAWTTHGYDANQSVTLTVREDPQFTGADSMTATVGAPVGLTVTTTGFPTPSIRRLGRLPNGLAFATNRDGTATISGSPAKGAGGRYVLTFTAKNTVASASQKFVLTVNDTPVIKSAKKAAATVGFSFAFTVESRSYPSASLAASGVLPSGLTFSDNGDGTATISGIAAEGTGGAYVLSIVARNGIGCDAIQAFTLTVREDADSRSGRR